MRLRKLALVAGALVVGGELLTRLVESFAATPTASLYSLIVPGEPRFTLRPNAQIVVPERYGNIAYDLNSRGFRDREHHAGSATEKIVLLGDSVTFGLGVPQSATYASLLSGNLARASGGHIEVVNLAVFAYDTRDELATFRAEGRSLSPTLVILQFYLNDFAIEDHAAPSQPTLGQRLVAARNQILNGSALYRRLQQWTLGLSYRALHDLRRTRWPDSLNASEPRSKLEYLQGHVDDSQIPAFEAIADIQQEATRAGAKLLLLVSPDETQLFRRDWDEIQTRIARFALSKGIPCLDLLSSLREDPRRAQLFLDGVHYSTQGHEVVAGQISDFLATHDLLDETHREVINAPPRH